MVVVFIFIRDKKWYFFLDNFYKLYIQIKYLTLYLLL